MTETPDNVTPTYDEETEEKKLRVLQATMRTVQDIVNNFLNALHLFEMEMPNDAVAPQCFDRLNKLARDTSRQLKALGDVEVVCEEPTAFGAQIAYTPPPRSDEDSKTGLQAFIASSLPTTS